MKTCAEYEMEIMDAFYGEGVLSQACQDHLATCQACRGFQESLYGLPGDGEAAMAVDDWAIQKAVDAAMDLVKKRNRRDRRAFFALTLACFALCLLLLSAGLGRDLFNAYLLVYFAGPLSLPMMIWKRQRGGQEHA
jgi:uncharacterized membrane protein YcjF (UPF0283 family)